MFQYPFSQRTSRRKTRRPCNKNILQRRLALPSWAKSTDAAPPGPCHYPLKPGVSSPCQRPWVRCAQGSQRRYNAAGGQPPCKMFYSRHYSANPLPAECAVCGAVQCSTVYQKVHQWQVPKCSALKWWSANFLMFSALCPVANQ